MEETLRRTGTPEARQPHHTNGEVQSETPHAVSPRRMGVCKEKRVKRKQDGNVGVDTWGRRPFFLGALVSAGKYKEKRVSMLV